MKDLNQATELAESMVSIGQQAGRRVSAILSDMNCPRAKRSGTPWKFRKPWIPCGDRARDLTELSLILASHMVYLGGAAPSIEEARAMVEGILPAGRVLRSFVRW